MTTLLFVLALLFMQRNTERAASPPTTAQVFPKEETTDKQGVAQATKPSTQDLTNFQNLTNLPSTRGLTNFGNLSNLIPEIKPNQDTSFYQKLAATLSLFSQATSPEKVYLQFDRLFFEPGDDIWFNAYVRDANSLKASPKSDILYVELLAPNGSVLKKINLLAKGTNGASGTAAGDFQLDANAPGGLYKIRAYTNWMRNSNDVFERNVQVQATVLPRLRMELDFMKKAYGPGDVVEAKLDLNTLANQPLANYDFSAKASLDGQQFTQVVGKTDGRGHAKVRVELPKGLETNDGLLNVLIQYNGQTESISRSIPIVLNKIDLQFMPEGGDMVAGLPATVAFKALNEWGKPADVAGKIVNSKGVEVATFESYHQGMGAFDFTPASGETYHAVLTKPVGTNRGSPNSSSPNSGSLIPDAFPRGFSMKINPLQKDTLTVEVNSTEDEALHVALVCRGEMRYMQTLPARAGSHFVRIPVKNLPIGIAQVTLFDSRELPRAERLVFLNHDKQLKVSVKTDKEKYLPREKVTMTVSVTDERGIPMPGQFSLAVADDNLLTFADDRQGHILSHLLLESELKGKVEEPNFYFEPKEKHPEKNELLALDYLMLTQGWRRLAWEEILEKQPVAMQFESERAGMTGYLVDIAGKPITNQKVVLGNSILSSVSDINGKFEFDTFFSKEAWTTIKTAAPYLSPKEVEFKGLKSAILKMPCTVSDMNEIQGITTTNPSNKVKLARLEGKVKDEITLDPIPFATVTLLKNGNLAQGVSTGIDGNFSIEISSSGVYDLEFSTIGYMLNRISNIPLSQGKTLSFETAMKMADMPLYEVAVMGKRPVVEQSESAMKVVIEENGKKGKDPKPKTNQPAKSSVPKKAEVQPVPPATNQVPTSDQVQQLPTRDVKGLASFSAGADEGEDLNIRGSRADATNYFIDGVRVSGNLPPMQNIEALEGMPLGVPAAFGSQEEVGNNWMEMDKAKQPSKEEAMAKAKDEAAIIRQIEAGNVSLPLKDNHRQAASLTFHAPRQFYAPKYDAPKTDNTVIRDDFRKTVFFAPKLEVGRNGRATVEFYNTDAISTFRTTVEGLGTDGSIGRAEQRFFTQMPFSMDVKVPVNLLTGDKLAFPLALANNTGKPLSGKLTITMPAGFSNTDGSSVLPKLGKDWKLVSSDSVGSTVWQTVLHESTTIYPEYEIALGAKSGAMQVSFEANGLSDAFTQELKVQPRGFPVDLVFGGNDRDKTFNVSVKDVVEGSLSATFTVHPSVLSDLTTGLERMLGQPNGCFEQTSSTNYPNILVLNLLKTTGNANAELEKRVNGFLDFGYKRLLTFEIPGGGFDWFASPPAHEALSAYGLMEFVDMKAVYPVEQDLIDRTAKWLLTRRDGKGGWLASKQGLHSWQQPNPVSDAYITWAMTEAGYGKQVSAEIAKLIKDARETKDPYIVALAAKSLLNLGDRRAEEMLTVLTKAQAANGSWTGKTQSMTQSTGANLTVETTALATLAFLANGDAAEGGQSATETAMVEKAVRYLAGAKTQYGFGSTQATVLALKALVANAKNMQKNIGGEVQLFVNGKSVGSRPFTADERNPVAFNGLEQYFTEGKNEVKVKFANGEPLPYDLSVKYSTTLPYSHPDCKLGLKTTLTTGSQQSSIGETVRLTSTLTNRSGAAVPNPIAIVGIPAGLSVQPWQVKEMQERKLCDFYEIKDSYVVFYFRGMDAGEVKNLHLDLKADVPGEYEAPASAAWLYYSNDAVVWSKPERVKIGK